MSDQNDQHRPDPDLDAEGFAAKHNIPVEEARRLIEEIGYDRGELDAAAQKLKLGQR